MTRQVAGLCDTCSKPVTPSRAVYEVTGWQRSGRSPVEAAKRTGRVRCRSCHDNVKAGNVPGQQTLRGIR